MADKLLPRHDWVAVLAFIFGAAVIVPSLIALAISIIAVGKSLF